VSHQPERKEKDCLNCGTDVHGRFCHVCGQENIVGHQNFWSLCKHFVYDILHFDGKFYPTLYNLFTRPGRVAKEYVKGKRASYLDPIRMYLFTSAVFFLIFFSVNSFRVNPEDIGGQISNKERYKLAKSKEKKLKSDPSDTVLQRQIALLRDTARPIDLQAAGLNEDYSVLSFSERKYNSEREYDSVQNLLPKAERDNWFKGRLIKKSIAINQKYGKDSEGANAFISFLVHKLPYLLFVSLPFFAFLLKLLYIRRKSFFYSDHAVFTLYHYIFTFILLLFVFAFNALKTWTGWHALGWLVTLLGIYWPVYLYFEMKTFYGQGWARTLGKFLLLNILGILVLNLLMIFFVLFSIFQS
jgi:hypothetical protein